MVNQFLLNWLISVLMLLVSLSIHTVCGNYYTLLLRLQNVNNGYFNSSLKTAGIENADNMDANTYSIIGNINPIDYINSTGTDNKYQFKIVYGYNDGSSPDIIIWKQSSWLTETAITGFQEISIPIQNYSGTAACKQFEGEGLSNEPSVTYLDGNAESNSCYWNSIGTISGYGGGIPGFSAKIASSQELWIYSAIPTTAPTVLPTKSPTDTPSNNPTIDPTAVPTANPTQNPSNNPTIDPTSIPTADPTQNPSNNPTIDPTAVPTADPTQNPSENPSSNPTLEPNVNPSSDPTIDPTIVPTTFPTPSPTKLNCELIRLNLTIKSLNNSLFFMLLQNVNKNKFTDILKENIADYYEEYKDGKLILTFDALSRINNISLGALCNLLNCNRNIQTLNNYLVSSQFNISFTNDINDAYYHQYNDDKTQYAVITDTHSKKIWSSLPAPFVLEGFNILHPVSIAIVTIFILVLLIILSGYGQSKCFRLCSVFGCKLTDSFNGSRVIFFILTVFILLNNLNTSYAYFYEFTIYHDTIFLILGIISLTLIILDIIYDGILVKKFENDSDIAMENKHIETWLNLHKYKLIFLIVISASFYHSLSLVNSNLFGINMFSMRLSNKQLFKFKIYKIWHILLAFFQLFVHSFFTFYIVIKGHEILNNDDQIKYLNIISIISCLFNVLSQIITRCSSTNFQHETINIDIRIQVDNENDKIKLQKQKDITKDMKKLLSELLEIYMTDIEIINTKNVLNGIIISCIIYNKIVTSNKNNYNSNKYESGLASIELQESLLNDDDNYTLSSSKRTDIENQLSSNTTKRLIKGIYSLNDIPSFISYDFNVRSITATFTKSIST